ncbi:hypothetical protein WK69_10685 [Burkholderia ubonensis]|uniref:hypothetical protein n=1 Tax=Burkholderia ubonensis TaxID=101571 RepID=UPI0007540061|nr:hypothetical protein [Burkholderia ubonensis]KVU48168.1 hypothetical protein WK69_10685 [Burkholderia ubonensis]
MIKYLGGIGLFLVGAIVGWAATMYWLHPPTDSGASASWVQAVGSIAAIAGAFGVVFAQKHLSDETAANEISMRRDKAKSLAALVVKNAAEASEELEVVVKMNAMVGERRDNAVDVLVDRRGQFDILAWEHLGKDQATTVEQARRCVTKLISICRKRPPESIDVVEREIAFSEVQQVSRELRDWLEKLEKSSYA